jgi:hypothetical protein
VTIIGNHEVALLVRLEGPPGAMRQVRVPVRTE